MNNFEQYVKDNKIEIVKCKIIGEMRYGGRRYKIKLRNQARKKLTILYVIPFARIPEPVLTDIFYTIVDEVQIFEKHQGFDRWIATTEGHVNVDQIPKAKKLYRELIKLIKKLKKFTGDSYSDLLACK